MPGIETLRTTGPGTPPAHDGREVEVSIVMPCLNEHETVGVCVEKAFRALASGGLVGEVVVADNGSTDGSIEIATALGARVVPVDATLVTVTQLLGGIEAARGRYVIMGDADDSYDFLEVPRFVAELRQGLRSRAGLPAAIRRRHRAARRDAVVAPLDRQPDVVVAGAADVQDARSRTSTAGCEGSPASRSTGSSCSARAWSSPPR